MDAEQAQTLICLVTQVRDFLYMGVWTLELIAGQIALNCIFKARERKWF